MGADTRREARTEERGDVEYAGDDQGVETGKSFSLYLLPRPWTEDGPRNRLLTYSNFHSVDMEEAGRNIRRNNDRNLGVVANWELSISTKSKSRGLSGRFACVNLFKCKNIKFRSIAG